MVSATLAAAIIAFSSDMSALADLNKFEAEMRGEFGIGSAAQFGSADLRLVSFILFYLLSAYVLLWEIAIIIELGSLIVVQESSACQ